MKFYAGYKLRIRQGGQVKIYTTGEAPSRGQFLENLINSAKQEFGEKFAGLSVFELRELPGGRS